MESTRKEEGREEREGRQLGFDESCLWVEEKRDQERQIESELLTSIQNILLGFDSIGEERSTTSHVRRNAERREFLVESDLSWRF